MKTVLCFIISPTSSITLARLNASLETRVVPLVPFGISYEVVGVAFIQSFPMQLMPRVPRDCISIHHLILLSTCLNFHENQPSVTHNE